MPPMRAAILSIGDELGLGRTVDTNSAWLSARLAALGAVSGVVGEHRTVGDDRGQIAATVRALAGEYELLIVTGGLGPTADDLTRFALGDVFTPGQELVEDAEAVAEIRRWFEGRDRAMPENNLLQALRPASMSCLENVRGTAPGLHGEWEGSQVFALPGPPGEMKPMFERWVAPHLPGAESVSAVHTLAVRCFGLGESEAAERLGDILQREVNPQESPLVGITVSHAIVTATVMMQGAEKDIRGLMLEKATEIEAAWSPFAYGREDDTLSSVAGELLSEKGKTLATAESCTGGLLGKMIVDIPGSSNYYLGGWITYTNALKENQLAVPPEVLEEHGAVSRQTAAAMAEGAVQKSGADNGLSITGIAGPGGGTTEKPEGTVFIGLADRQGNTRDKTMVRQFKFRPGNRYAIRERSAEAALQMLRFHLLGILPEVIMLWEVRGESE